MGSNAKNFTVEQLVKLGILEKPIDGNHGGIHPKSSDFVSDGIPFIMASDLKNGMVDVKNCKFISLEQAKGLRKGFARKNDVLLSHKATLGRTAVIGDIKTDFLVLTPQITYYRVKDTNKLNPYYLKYYFDSKEFQNLFEQWGGGGSTRLYLGITEQLKLPIEIPSIETQNYIVDVIDTLDQKISLNRQINQTLEQMAQTLFKSWFVDFDPVIDNALDAGNEIPESLQARAELRQKVCASQDFQPLPTEVRELFPAEFEERELGWVPKGWKCSSVSDAISVNPSVKLAKGNMAKFVDMKALPTSGYSVEEVIEKPYSGGAKFQKNDILFARITPCLENGKTGFVDFLGDSEVGFGSTEFIVLRSTKKIHFGFVACLARDDAFRAHAIQSMVGSSGRQRVQNSCFDAYQIAVPEQSVMSKFSDLVEVSFSKMTTTNAEIASLSQLRDTLLPKLISGELRLDEIPSP